MKFLPDDVSVGDNNFYEKFFVTRRGMLANLLLCFFVVWIPWGGVLKVPFIASIVDFISARIGNVDLIASVSADPAWVKVYLVVLGVSTVVCFILCLFVCRPLYYKRNIVRLVFYLPIFIVLMFIIYFCLFGNSGYSDYGGALWDDPAFRYEAYGIFWVNCLMMYGCISVFYSVVYKIWGILV